MKQYSVLEEQYKYLFSVHRGRIRSIACGIGWYDLIESLLYRIDLYVKYVTLPEFKIIQIKEKFGSLRFYVDGSDDYIEGMISFAQTQSHNICENCGTNQNIGSTTTGWIRILCKSCGEIPEIIKTSKWSSNEEIKELNSKNNGLG